MIALLFVPVDNEAGQIVSVAGRSACSHCDRSKRCSGICLPGRRSGHVHPCKRALAVSPRTTVGGHPSFPSLAPRRRTRGDRQEFLRTYAAPGCDVWNLLLARSLANRIRTGAADGASRRNGGGICCIHCESGRRPSVLEGDGQRYLRLIAFCFRFLLSQLEKRALCAQECAPHRCAKRLVGRRHKARVFLHLTPEPTFGTRATLDLIRIGGQVD